MLIEELWKLKEELSEKKAKMSLDELKVYYENVMEEFNKLMTERSTKTKSKQYTQA